MPRPTRAHQRRLLISRVARKGMVMAFKCLECQRKDVDCQRSTADSKSCLSCLRSKKPCVLEPYSEHALQRLEAHREAIRLREEEARDRASRLALELSEAHGQVNREKKTLDLLDKKIEKMVRLGLENLEELEAEEAASEERARQSTPSVAGAGVGDFNFDAYLSADPVSPSAWVLPSSGTD